jgi:hypothetical protein
MQSGTDGLAAAGYAKPLAHPGNQALERPAGCRVGAGYGWNGGGALGITNDLAKAGFDAGTKGGRPPVRR